MSKKLKPLSLEESFEIASTEWFGEAYKKLVEVTEILNKNYPGKITINLSNARYTKLE